MFKPLSIAICVSAVAVTSLVSAKSLTLAPAEVRQLAPQPGLEYGSSINDFELIPLPVEPDVVHFRAGAHYYKEALTSTKPRISDSEKFIPLPGAYTVVKIPAGRSALVNVAFTAESRCNELNSTAQNWCEVRILVDGVEASPQASSFPPDTYAFDSTDIGTESIASWESHAMDRHHCVDNSNGSTTKAVPVTVEWKVTNFDGGSAPSFWLDDWSFTIELANSCRRTVETVD